MTILATDQGFFIVKCDYCENEVGFYARSIASVHGIARQNLWRFAGAAWGVEREPGVSPERPHMVPCVEKALCPTCADK